MGSSVRTMSVLCRSAWIASITSWFGGKRVRVPAWPDQTVMRGEQLIDLPGNLHARVDEHDEVVADALEIGDEVRGENDAHAMFGDDLHQAPEEVASGNRVEAGDRLVQDQQLGPLCDRKRQRELGSLATRELSGPLPGIESELFDPVFSLLRLPAGVEPAAEAQVVRDRQRRVGGVSWATKPTRPSCAGLSAGRPPSTAIVPAVGSNRPTARCSSVVLPAPFGPTSPTTFPAGIESVQSRSAQRRPYCLPSPLV